MDDFKPTLKRTAPPKDTVIDSIYKRPLLAVRELNNRSFYRFLKYMWPEVSPEHFSDNWHIKFVCDELQKLAERVVEERHRPTRKVPIKDLIINIPPGTTKTTITMIMFPAWCWTRWYWMEFIGLSYSATLSLESAEACKDLIESERFKATYPDISIRQDKSAKSNFQVLRLFNKRSGYAPSIKQGGSRYSTSVGGTLTGFHAHIILIDDPINPEQAVSPVQLESANRWLENTLPTRKIHKAISPEVYIMQRLHKNDPTGHKLKREKDSVRHISLPGELRDYENELKPKSVKKFYSEDGLLDPTRMGWEVLDNLKAKLGQYGYAGQMGQSPTPPEGGMFKVGNIKPTSMPQRHEILRVVRAWDKAGTEAKNSQKGKGPAWTVGVKMALLSDKRYLIMDVVRGRWSSGEREKEIKQTAIADGNNVKVIIEQEPGSGGKESAENTVKNLAGFKVKVDKPRGDKAQRADPFSVQVEWRNVYMLKGEWNAAYIEELRFFPFGSFKDQVDASSMAFNELHGNKEVRAI